jgi:hypothetical protein
MSLPTHFKLNTGAQIPVVGLGEYYNIHVIGEKLIKKYRNVEV